MGNEEQHYVFETLVVLQMTEMASSQLPTYFKKFQHFSLLHAGIQGHSYIPSSFKTILC